MNRNVTTVIDRERCDGCGQCIAVCPKDTISLEDGLAMITGNESLNCGHCAAVCPQGAISVGSIDLDLSSYNTFTTDETWLPFGAFETGDLVQLMRSRRSCRNYTQKPVERPVLEDLVKIGITAPSGSNCQLWSFTILPDRKSVLDLANQIKSFFKKINRLAGKTWLRTMLSLIGRPTLSTYYETHYESVKQGLDRWEKLGQDLLFHGAPAVIIAASRNDATCPAEDALLATQNILLAAHCMGIGTCLIGYAIEVMRRNKNVNRFVGIPDDETPYAVIALGYPEESYTSVAGRHRMRMRYFDPESKNPAPV
jgi:nitroreductase/NAD-dependent dihydropyrimidine dehydrogenase PreA subunit